MREDYAVNYFNIHKNKPAIILGNGPSLNNIRGHEEYIKSNFITIGMNTSWQLMQTQYHIIMFHYEHLEDLKRGKWVPKNCILWAFKDYCEMVLRDINEGTVIYVPSVADPKNEMHQYNYAGMISTDISDCSYADMTGHFALEVAVWMRCNPIYLIGFDLYGGHFNDKLKPEDEWRGIQVDLMDMAAAQLKQELPQIKIYNLNPESAIEGFEKKELGDVLDD